MIHIIHSLGGCGGTVLSRCIGVLPDVALLSEINPGSVKLFSHISIRCIKTRTGSACSVLPIQDGSRRWIWGRSRPFANS